MVVVVVVVVRQTSSRWQAGRPGRAVRGERETGREWGRRTGWDGERRGRRKGKGGIDDEECVAFL